MVSESGGCIWSVSQVGVYGECVKRVHMVSVSGGCIW